MAATFFSIAIVTARYTIYKNKNETKQTSMQNKVALHQRQKPLNNICKIQIPVQ